MKLLTAILLFLYLSIVAFALRGQEVFLCGSRNEALAGATVALSDCWSVFGNQAGLARLTQPEVGGSFQNRFGINTLAIKSGLFALPIQSSVIAISIVQFGRIPFKQEFFGLAYAKKLGARLNFGLQFNYSRIFFPEDNCYSGTVGLNLGIQVLLNQRFILGLHISNPYTTQIKTISNKFQYPPRVKFGSLLILTKEFRLISELENDFNNHFVARAGFEYSFLEKFVLRTGIAGKPNRLTAGIGFQLNKFSMDVANSYHPDLGSSSSVSFQYQF